ncbi:hypothetical protein GYB59_19415 [bacterium]|uniref:hypothetical protein n=1 Tax=Rubinisphaera brasiliensis TaxID=119 RepID=UPI0001E7209E|nr:hypothetical protein [Rubinisphaera brasiliensis]MBR9803719.1 hypothetical protein [bacterium]
MILVDRQGTPSAIDTASASSNEATLIAPLLEKMTLKNRQPQRLIYDEAGDINRVRDSLAEQGVD